MPQSAVVDASVLVSAFLFPESLPGRVFQLAGRGVYLMHLSTLLLEETNTALLSSRLRDAYGYDEASVAAWCTGLQATAKVFSGPLPAISPACRDPNDDHVIATAIAVGAGVIVTGDKDLLALGQFRNVRVLTARQFLSELQTGDLPQL